MRPSRVFAERSARPPVRELSNEFRVEVEPRRDAVGSTGLRLVLDAYSASVRDGTEFAVIAGPSDVQRAFEVAGLHSRSPFVEAGSRRDGGAWA